MTDIAAIQIKGFILIYALLVIVSVILKLNNINMAKELILSSARMSIQLVLAGLILVYIFENPHSFFVIAYIVIMIAFSVFRVLKKCPNINRIFKIYAGLSIAVCGLIILCFFVIFLIGKSIFDPRYTIPISGMLIGNSMTGLILGINNFMKEVSSQKIKIQTLINIGANPKQILKPIVANSVKTAALPTLNNMVGMGVISLPGMMTGQILSGTLPTTAVAYQICIIIAITMSSIMTTFIALTFGYKTYIDTNQNIKISQFNNV